MPFTTDSLVFTKLRPFQTRPKLVARPRLTATLEREAGRELTLISALAGFGVDPPLRLALLPEDYRLPEPAPIRRRTPGARWRKSCQRMSGNPARRNRGL